MRFLNLKLFLFCALLVAGVHRAALAEEGEAAAKPAESPGDKEQKEFNEKSTKLTSLGVRVDEAERHFKELTQAKAEAKTPAEKQRIIAQMNAAIADRNKAFDEYNRLKAELILRYPNQGVATPEHHEKAGRGKEPEELQKTASFDDQLKRTKAIVDKKYAPFSPQVEQDVKAKPAAEEAAPPAPLKLER